MSEVLRWLNREYLQYLLDTPLSRIGKCENLFAYKIENPTWGCSRVVPAMGIALIEGRLVTLTWWKNYLEIRVDE